MNLVIKNCTISEEFIREYETHMESISDFEYGTLYKIEVFLNENGLNAGVAEELEEDYGEEENHGFVKKYDDQLVFITPVSSADGVHEIEIAMYYTLKGNLYGDYTWTCLQLWSERIWPNEGQA